MVEEGVPFKSKETPDLLIRCCLRSGVVDKMRIHRVITAEQEAAESVVERKSIDVEQDRYLLVVGWQVESVQSTIARDSEPWY